MKPGISEQFQRLREAVPERSVAGVTAVFGSSQTLRDWLGRLPLANPGLAASRLAALLKELNLAKLEPRDRLQALETLRAPIHDLVDSLNRQLHGEAFPMRAAKLQAGQLAQEFMADFALGYTEVVCDQCTLTGTVPFLRGKTVSLALTRAIQYQGARLFNAYLMHAAPAPGIWQALHDLFRFGQSIGRDTAAEVDPLAGDAKISARGAYIQALLHAFAKPYQFTQNEIAELHIALPALAGYCDVSPGYAMSGSIAVVTDGDHVPSETPRARRTDIANQWMLDVSRLLPMLDVQLEAATGARQVNLPRRSGVPMQLSTGLVTRLVQIWKARCARAHPRTADQSVIHTLIGMQAVHFAFSGNVDFATFQRGIQDIDAKSIDKAEGQIWANATASQELSLAMRAATVDRSVGGCRLRWDNESGIRARVSEIIALAPDEPGAHWTIGILRWLRADSSGAVEAGIEKMPPARTVAVSLRGLDARGTAGVAVRGLLMLPEPTDAQNASEPYVIASRLFDRDVSSVEITRLGEAPDADQVDRISNFHLLDRGGEYLQIVMPGYVGDATASVALQTASEALQE